MAKQLISILLSVFAAASLLVACQPAALDEIIDPNPQEPEVVPERTTIPYSLKVGTEGTRVTFVENQDGSSQYVYKDGDHLHIVGLDNRDDIVGDLTVRSGDTWSGTLSYSTDKGKPGSGTNLKVTLIHADNPNLEEYGTALVGGVPTGDERTLLQYAVENYSLFTAQYEFGATGTINLEQQAAFLDVTFTFDFDGSHQVEPGQAWVDLEIDGKELSVQTQFFAADENEEDFQVHFMAVIPGGRKTDEFALLVGERAIEFQKNSATDTYPTLERNKKYTVTRSVAYRPQLGDPYWSDGTYGRLNHSDPNASIVGIVVYINHNYQEGTEKARIDDAITEKRKDENGKQLYGRGLVMALKNVTWNGQNRFIWSGTDGNIKCTAGFITTPSQTMDSPYFSGLENTDKIIEKLGNGRDSAASLAKQYGDKPGSSSGWFLPSIGQWMYTISIDGFGNADHAYEWINGNGQNWLKNGNVTGDLVYVKKCEDGSVNVLVKALNDRLEKLHRDFSDYNFEYDSFGDPSGEANVSDNYWTSTEKTDNQAIRMNLGTVEERQGIYYSTIKAKGESKQTLTPYGTYQMKVRPFLAF